MSRRDIAFRTICAAPVFTAPGTAFLTPTKTETAFSAGSTVIRRVNKTDTALDSDRRCGRWTCLRTLEPTAFRGHAPYDAEDLDISLLMQNLRLLTGCAENCRRAGHLPTARLSK